MKAYRENTIGVDNNSFHTFKYIFSTHPLLICIRELKSNSNKNWSSYQESLNFLW